MASNSGRFPTACFPKRACASATAIRVSLPYSHYFLNRTQLSTKFLYATQVGHLFKDETLFINSSHL
jgi:hypothetical protein